MSTGFVSVFARVGIRGLALGVGMALMALSPGAMAQEAAGEPAETAAEEAPAEETEVPSDEAAADDTIIVHGFRGSLKAALATKRNETELLDAIKAEDIADFPDLNLAESMQRIPGVSITRQAGEGRQITVRGLDGRFTRVRINGMEALTTTGASDAGGGSNRERFFDFNIFSSELFNELVVRKTQSASTEEGSLGANVELKTPQPFDFGPGFTGAASGQAIYNDLNNDFGPRLAGLASWTNPSETFGALVSIAYSDRSIREEGFSTVRFDDFATFRSVNGVPCTAPLNADCNAVRNAYYARIPRYGRLDYEQERLGLTGSLQFRPFESTTLSLDGLYSRFDGTRDEEFLEVFFRSETDNIDITDYSINSDGVLEFLTANIQPDAVTGIVPVRSEHRRDLLTTDFYQFTGTLEHEFTTRFRANVFGGIARSKFDVPVQATIFYDAAEAVNGYVLDFTESLETPHISFGDLDVTDPGSFLFTQFRNRPQGVDNSYDTIQPGLEFDLVENLTLKAGFSWKRYTFETREARAEGSVTSLPGITEFIPVTDEIANLLTDFGEGLGAPDTIDTEWVSADWDAAVDLIGLLDITPAPRAQDTRGVVEEDYGVYLQADFRLDLGSVPLRGNAGLRYVETNVASTGFTNVDGDFLAVTVERTYDDWLPALNLVAEVWDDFLMRGGVAKVMSRPDLGDLTPGGSIDTFNGPPFEIDMGNPGLDPYRAWTYDLSFEWYFQEESLLAVALFYKDISSFFQASAVVETTFSQSGLPASVASPTSPLAQLLADGQDPAVEISQVVNGGDSFVEGIEFIYQQPFSFLPAPFDKFGFTGNYTYAFSPDIINFSEHAFNATLWYEDDRFSARVSTAYRSDFQTTPPVAGGRTAGREERGVAATFHLDFAAAYSINERMQITFEATNLTDEFEHQTFDVLKLPEVYHHTGRNFLLGARYRY